MRRLNESRIGALLTEPFAVAFSKQASTSLHTEHGTAVLVGLDADVTVTTASRTITARAVLVAADTPYTARCAAPTVSFTFDPELCRLGTDRDATPLSKIAAAIHAHRATLAQRDTMSGLGTELARALPTHARPIDRRIARLVEALRDPDAPLPPLSLSPAHVQALFVRDIGTPIRTYRLWRRLLHALAHVGPLDLTASAHAAGFADLAHFSRTCRRMLGYAPSELRANLVAG